MDKNNKQEENQEKQKKSAIDRLNQGIDYGRNTKSAIQGAKKGIKTARKGVKIARTTLNVIRGGQAVATIATTAASTAPVWGPIALVIGFILLVVIVIVVITTGVSVPPTCKSLTTDKTTVNKDNPATLSLNDCPENVTYSWTLPKIGGSFNTPSSNTTTYTPPGLNQDTKVKIAVNVCAQNNDQNCSEYSISLNISYAPPSYPGITYNLTGPKNCDNPCRVKKGEPVDFNIEIKYDQDKAEVPIENVSATITLSTAVFTINSISGKTTSEFNPNLPLVKYIWNLSENIRSQDEDSKIKTFIFKINLTPYINNVETGINLSIVGANP
ncbi:MAG: hypothetical protein AAB532_02930 [Patescibacteria group bacterium]